MNSCCIEIVAVAFERFGELKVFVQSILNQTRDNWKLHVIHDGPNQEFEQIMQDFCRQAPEQISFSSSERRYNDYGHSLREIGLRDVTGDYILITNADNYYVPKFLEFILGVIEQGDVDVVMYDMVHSHHNPGGRDAPSYSYFKTDYSHSNIDMGAAVIKRELAQTAGFPDKSFAGDATYFSRVLAIKGAATQGVKINRVLLVHN
ncbi:glycosyltransferase [Uliginosibacterium sp. 31-16]|uniref:glycosyltransferase family 2 protein n=1 Tax=Uliginosibacterium sp. 31-16 TaxID=3068315 RepID=UPI00273F18F9|nr:glycosyltransferase [Uliginosibacterium sp. 31-16]MDP5240530.1 glycosyltransferase [Uliginosibacterium sp. 31-16]